MHGVQVTEKLIGEDLPTRRAVLMLQKELKRARSDEPQQHLGDEAREHREDDAQDIGCVEGIR